MNNDIPWNRKRHRNGTGKRHVPIDPGLIRAEAIRQGWEPRAGDRLQELAAKVAEGRAVRGGGRVTKTRAKQAAVRWEEEAAASD